MKFISSIILHFYLLILEIILEMLISSMKLFIKDNIENSLFLFMKSTGFNYKQKSQ